MARTFKLLLLLVRRDVSPKWPPGPIWPTMSWLSAFGIQGQLYFPIGNDIKITVVVSLAVDVLTLVDFSPETGINNLINVIGGDIFEKNGFLQVLLQLQRHFADQAPLPYHVCSLDHSLNKSLAIICITAADLNSARTPGNGGKFFLRWYRTYNP